MYERFFIYLGTTKVLYFLYCPITSIAMKNQLPATTVLSLLFFNTNDNNIYANLHPETVVRRYSAKKLFLKTHSRVSVPEFHFNKAAGCTL